MTKQNIKVRVLLYQDNNTWVAQCLEYDIATQGSTTQIALDAFERVFLGQISLDLECGLEPLQSIKKAPNDCLNKFEKAHPLKEQRQYQPLKDGFQHLIQASATDMRIFA